MLGQVTEREVVTLREMAAGRVRLAAGSRYCRGHGVVAGDPGFDSHFAPLRNIEIAVSTKLGRGEFNETSPINGPRDLRSL